MRTHGQQLQTMFGLLRLVMCMHTHVEVQTSCGI
jgi:hypothetical protein